MAIPTEPMDPLSSSLREITERRPKSVCSRPIASLVEAHLPSLVTEGLLSHTLVTVLPDITVPLAIAWHALPAVVDRIEVALTDLAGMYFSLIATEVHGGSRPKKRKSPATPVREGGLTTPADQEPHPNEEHEEEMEPEAPAEGAPAATPPRRSKLQGLPHVHVLLYSLKAHVPALDASFVKRRLLEEFPKGDVNQVLLKNPKRSQVVGAMTYVLKGHECPVFAACHRLCRLPETLLLRKLVLGTEWAPGSPCGTRLKALLGGLTGMIDHQLSVDEAEAPESYTVAPNPSKETLALSQFASKVQSLGYRRRGDMWYGLREGTRFTYEPRLDLDGLLRLLSEDMQFLDICVRYASKIRSWTRLAPFVTLPDQCYRYIELRDAVYDLSTGLYVDKLSFRGVCFRSYDINVYRSIVTEPLEWLALLAYQYDSSLLGQMELESFLEKHAKLLRQRRPKEKIQFIVGESNSGKSTAIGWITSLYPIDAIATVNDSIAPFSSLEGRAILMCDEFSTSKISRSNLLRLTDGSTGLDVRRLGENAHFITDVLMPQIYTCNPGFEPKYKNDTSNALENRFDFVRWNRSIPADKISLDKAQACIEETPFIVFFLNRINNKH